MQFEKMWGMQWTVADYSQGMLNNNSNKFYANRTDELKKNRFKKLMVALQFKS